MCQHKKIFALQQLQQHEEDPRQPIHEVRCRVIYLRSIEHWQKAQPIEAKQQSVEADAAQAGFERLEEFFLETGQHSIDPTNLGQQSKQLGADDRILVSAEQCELVSCAFETRQQRVDTVEAEFSGVLLRVEEELFIVD